MNKAVTDLQLYLVPVPSFPVLSGFVVGGFFCVCLVLGGFFGWFFFFQLAWALHSPWIHGYDLTLSSQSSFCLSHNLPWFCFPFPACI